MGFHALFWVASIYSVLGLGIAPSSGFLGAETKTQLLPNNQIPVEATQHSKFIVMGFDETCIQIYFFKAHSGGQNVRIY